MKTELKHLVFAFMFFSAMPGSHAQEAVPDALVEASKALAGGSEVRAWKLFSEGANTFSARMKELDGPFVVWVANQYRKQKRYAEAAAITDSVVADSATFGNDTVASAMLTKGDILRNQENYAAARLEYQSLERNDELRQTAAGKTSRFRLVEINRLTKDYKAAEDMLERLRDSRDIDTQAETYYQSAMIAFDREAYDEARELVEEARKRNPAHLEALFLEAQLNLIEDRLQDPELEIGTRVLSSYVIPGRPVTLKMQDRNLAVVRGGSGIPVQLVTSNGGDVERVVLLPSPRDTTLFRATVHSTLGEVEKGNQRLEVNGNDIVTYRLDADFLKANDLSYAEKRMIVASDAELTASSGEFVSEDELQQRLLDQRIARATSTEKTQAAYEAIRDTSVIRPGNEIHVQLVDADRDLGAELDEVFVEARASSGDLVSGVKLTETAANSAIFRGTIQTDRASPKASATGTVKGTRLSAPLSSLDSGVWAGEGEGVSYTVDLMAVHPLDHANLTVDPQSGIERVTLLSGFNEAMTEIASTHPSQQGVYGYVDLAAHFGEKAQKTSAYLYTEVESDKAQAAVLKIGSCDGVVCWLNGERVHNNQGGRIWKPEADVVNVNLLAGMNAILLRVSQLTGPWGVSLTLLDANGQGLSTVSTPLPLKPGVVTAWHLFDRLTPENIKVARSLNVNRPIRVAGKFFYWVPMDVCPPASLKLQGEVLSAVFNRPLGVRHLRWAFEGFSGPRVTIKYVDVKNHFDEQVLPTSVDYAADAKNRTLELGPGDKVSITYADERRISSEEILEANLSAHFHNAAVTFVYDLVDTMKDGNRKITYDKALRYRAGETSRLMLRVVDYDSDTSAEADTIKVLVENSARDKLWMEALETEPHSGSFLGVLRLGTAMAKDTMRVGHKMHLTAAYQDRENSDGVVARIAQVLEADDDPPELIPYRSLVTYPSEPKDATAAPVEPKILEEASKKGTVDDPVVTSMAAPVTFHVIYPDAALREGSRLTADVTVLNADGAAEDSSLEGRAGKVQMSVVDGKLGEFAGSVFICNGMSQTSPDAALFAPRVSAGEMKVILDARGGERIRVVVKSLDGSVVREAQYRLASDAMVQFVDRKYHDVVDHLYIGDYLYVVVSDLDMDTTDGLDNVTVHLVSGGSTRDVMLAESLPHSGRFSGRLRTEPVFAVSGGDALPSEFGGTITATYQDAFSVIESAGRAVVATLQLHEGADGSIAGFSKRFSEEDIAVRTRLLTAEALFEMAKDYRKTDQAPLADETLAEGRVILEEAIADYPHTVHAPHAEYLLGDLAQELEKYGEALARYNKVLSTWPDSEYAARAQLRKGVCLEKMEDFDNAMDAYVELTYLYPKSELVSDAVIRLGQHFYRAEAYAIAGRIFGRFEAQHPEHPLAAKTLFLSAQSFMKKADQQTATGAKRTAAEWLIASANAFERLTDTYDDKDLCAESLYWLANCRMKQLDYQHAYMAFKSLTIDYPESKWAKFARGQLAQNDTVFSKINE